MLKSIFKKWLLKCLFDLSSWIGAVMFTFEILRHNPSNFVLGLSLALVFIPEAELKAFMTKQAAKIQKMIS